MTALPRFHTDHLNTPRLVADATGTTVWRWDQAEPFGNNPANEDPDANTVTFDLPLRLPGQRYDQETGLHYNYFRDYDPSIGRYGESDLIGLDGGLNTYAYGLSDPLTGSDPLGLRRGRSTQADPYPWCAGNDAACRAGLVPRCTNSRARDECLLNCWFKSKLICEPIGAGAGTIVGAVAATAASLSCTPPVVIATFVVTAWVVDRGVSFACGRIMSKECREKCPPSTCR